MGVHVHISILTGHGAELPYVFHTLEDLYTGHEKELADIVSRYWGNFVNTGNPNKRPASKNNGKYAADVQGYPVSTL